MERGPDELPLKKILGVQRDNEFVCTQAAQNGAWISNQISKGGSQSNL